VTAAPRLWVLASGNSGKLREIQSLLSGSELEIVPQGDFGVSTPEETQFTFVENALLKARHASTMTGLPAIADDSGLTVDALGGAPGISSARFAGSGDDQANVAKLLDALQGVPDEQRGACFHCVVVALLSAQDPAPMIGQGQWTGTITRHPRGRSGFGYDPVFFDPELNATAAELPPQTKNQVSHRSRALAQLRRALERRMAVAGELEADG